MGELSGIFKLVGGSIGLLGLVYIPDVEALPQPYKTLGRIALVGLATFSVYSAGDGMKDLDVSNTLGDIIKYLKEK